MGLKQKTLAGIFWTFSQQFSVQIIGFGVRIILARLLLPADFGLIAMLSVFIAVGATLIDSGMTTSLIRCKTLTQKDYSTVFFSNIVISIFIYGITFLCAPLVAKFYEIPILSDILRVYSVTFILSSFIAVHMTKLTKELDFKTQMKLQIPSTIIGGAIGIVMALNDYGVWSLVGMYLSQSVIFLFQCWTFLKWKPSFMFDWDNFKFHFNFGYKMTISSLIDTLYNNLYNIFIGKFFSATLVGYYNQADNLRLFPVSQISSVLSKVTFPVFSTIKDDRTLKKAYRTTMNLILFLIIPVMSYLILVAEPLFLYLLGDKWMPAVPYFKILCLASIVRPIGTYNLNILKVKGRSDLLLKVEIIKKVIGLIAFFIVLPYGILALVWLLTITSFLFAFLNGFFCGNLINYNLREQLLDFHYPLFLGILAFLAAYFMFNYFPLEHLPDLFILLVKGIIYLLIYLLITYIANKSVYIELINVFKK